LKNPCVVSSKERRQRFLDPFSEPRRIDHVAYAEKGISE
jgi:hypothetical protein